MKISVGLCTYNGQKYIQKQLNSILDQTRQVDEILIFDDCSSDNTIKILQEYQQQYPSIIRVKQNIKNLKSVKNFEQALSACTGDIIFLSDQDDLWVPQKVEEYLDYFDKNPDLNVLCSNGFLIDEDDEVIDAVTLWDIPTILKEQNKHINYFDCISYRANIATGASMAIRKSFIKYILPIPVLKILIHDEWIALLASANNSFEIMDKKLFYYRIHPQQQVGIIPYVDNIKSRQNLYKKFCPLKEESFAELKIAMKVVASRYNQLATEKHEPPMHVILQAVEEKYLKLRKSLLTNYPAQGILTIIADKITKKRQLYK